MTPGPKLPKGSNKQVQKTPELHEQNLWQSPWPKATWLTAFGGPGGLLPLPWWGDSSTELRGKPRGTLAPVILWMSFAFLYGLLLRSACLSGPTPEFFVHGAALSLGWCSSMDLCSCTLWLHGFRAVLHSLA